MVLCGGGDDRQKDLVKKVTRWYIDLLLTTGTSTGGVTADRVTVTPVVCMSPQINAKRSTVYMHRVRDSLWTLYSHSRVNTALDQCITRAVRLTKPQRINIRRTFYK